MLDLCESSCEGRGISLSIRIQSQSGAWANFTFTKIIPNLYIFPIQKRNVMMY